MLLLRGSAAVVLSLRLIGMGVGAEAAETPSKEVTVLNPPSAPVPVTATTPLPVAGSVAATQGGPWVVGIGGTPIVNVAPPQRYTATLTRDADSTFGRWTNDTGRRFIIEVVSEEFSDKGLLQLTVNDAHVGGAYRRYWFPAYKGSEGFYPNIYFAHALTKISVEPGGLVFSESMTDAYNHYNQIYLSGYLE
jgi:hypothetical protein